MFLLYYSDSYVQQHNSVLLGPYSLYQKSILTVIDLQENFDMNIQLHLNISKKILEQTDDAQYKNITSDVSLKL